MMASDIKNNDIRLSDYQYGVIYKTKTVKPVAIKLENLLTQHGITVIGKKEAKNHKDQKILAFRFTESAVKDFANKKIGTSLNISIEDYNTAKALMVVTGTQKYQTPDAAWDKAAASLSATLKAN